MRTRITHLAFIILLNLSAIAEVSTDDKKKTFTFVGRLKTDSFPVKLVIEEGNQNEEKIFLKSLKAEDTFTYSDVVVKIKGKFTPYKNGSYILRVESIKRN